MLVGLAAVLTLPKLATLFHCFAAAMKPLLGTPLETSVSGFWVNLPAASVVQPHDTDPMYVPACFPSTASATVSNSCAAFLPGLGIAGLSFSLAIWCC